MKKKTKILTTCSFAVMALVGSVMPTSSVLAAGNAQLTEGDKIYIRDFKSNFEANEVVAIPYGYVGATAVVPVVTGYNGQITINTSEYDMNGDMTMDSVKIDNPTLTSYKVTYTSGDTTKSYNISITNTNVKMSFLTNTSIFLPKESVKNKAITIPYPIIKDADGNEVELTQSQIASAIQISVVAPNGKYLTATASDSDNRGTLNDSQTNYVGSIKYKQFTPTVGGTYTVKYYLNTNGFKGFYNKTVYINNNLSEERTISYEFSSSMPTTASLGEKLTLPTVKVYYLSGNDNIETEGYAIITVRHKNDDGTFGDPVTLGSDNTFTPSENGSYEIAYVVKDFLGNETSTYKTTIINVKDKTSPTVMIVSDYVVANVANANFVDTLTDASSILPSRIGKTGLDGNGVIFPAIYGYDNYNAYNDIILKREIVSASGSTTVIGDASNLHTAVRKTFTEAGTYTVKYSARDAAGNSKEISYQLVITENLSSGTQTVDTLAPELTFSGSLPKTTTPNQEISFKKPSVIDYYMSGDDKVVGDSRLDIVSKLYLGDVATGTLVGTIEEDEDNANNLKVIVPTSAAITASGKDFLTLTFTTTDDHGNQTSISRIINLVIPENDTTAAVIGSFVDFGVETLYQGTDVVIPDIKIADANIKSAFVNVIIKAGNQVIPFTGLTRSYNTTNETVNATEYSANQVLTLSGIKINAAYSGTYTISLEVVDQGENISVLDSTFVVAEVANAKIEAILDSTTVEIGETVNLNNFVIKNNGTKVDFSSYTNGIPEDLSLAADGYYYEITVDGVEAIDNKFVPTVAGKSYKVLFKTAVKIGTTTDIDEKEFSLDVKDNTKPIIDENEIDNLLKTFYKLGTTPEAIIIPNFTATDASTRYSSLTTKVELYKGSTTSGTKLDDVSLITTPGENLGKYTYTPTTITNSFYTIKFIATDSYGNESAVTRTIEYGDCKAPEVTMGGQDINLPGNKKLNDIIELDLSKISIFDEYNSNDIDVANLRVTLTDADGNIVEAETEGTHKYKLAKAGQYKLSYIVSDGAGNTETVTHDFEVVADAEEPTDNGTNVGVVVAIVVSLVVLAGVIAFFFIYNGKGFKIKRGKKTIKKNSDSKKEDK